MVGKEKFKARCTFWTVISSFLERAPPWLLRRKCPSSLVASGRSTLCSRRRWSSCAWRLLAAASRGSGASLAISRLPLGCRADPAWSPPGSWERRGRGGWSQETTCRPRWQTSWGSPARSKWGRRLCRDKREDAGDRSHPVRLYPTARGWSDGRRQTRWLCSCQSWKERERERGRNGAHHNLHFYGHCSCDYAI